MYPANAMFHLTAAVSAFLRILIHLAVLRPFARIYFGLRFYGSRNLKQFDRFIIIANHNSHLDTLMIYCSLPVFQIARTHPVAAREYFIKPRVLFYLVDFLFKPIWIDRSEKDDGHQRIEKIKACLNRGHNLIIFPEGTRGAPGQIAKFKTGIGRLAQEYASIPVVTMYLSGPEAAFPKGTNFPVPVSLAVTIDTAQVSRLNYLEITSCLENKLKRLCSINSRV
jgi:1-acyl-sn-glycerol-3-phosphate acyltransferase